MTLLFDPTAKPEASIAAKKFTLLPVLTALFLFSYGLMTLLIVEQGTTIESQKGLIREMLRDSVELSAMKVKAIQEKNMAAQRQAQTQAQAPSTQVPSTQTPSTQIPMTQAPSTQVAPNHNARNDAGKKQRFQIPSRPASDISDERRSVMTI